MVCVALCEVLIILISFVDVLYDGFCNHPIRSVAPKRDFARTGNHNLFSRDKLAPVVKGLSVGGVSLVESIVGWGEFGSTRLVANPPTTIPRLLPTRKMQPE